MPRRNSIYLFVVLFVIGLLLYEIFVAKGETYYYTALGIILVGLIGFFLHFESGKPHALLLTMIASLCALAIVSRIAFFILPQIKPVAAVIILAGVAFGAEVGFVTGAVSAFVSNFYFGQGSWTPFQMFAFGLIGALAGVFFYGRRQTTWKIALYGLFSVLFIYGGIVDLNTIFFASQEINLPIIFSIYASALPFNLLFAVSTSPFIQNIMVSILLLFARFVNKTILSDNSSYPL